MKARYRYDILEPRPEHQGDERLIEKDGLKYWPAGTIEEHPKAYMLVRMGTAEPADEECTLAAAMSTAEQKAAQRSNEAVRRGIAPEDYQRFFDGEILGYNEDGSDIPGPNYIAPDDEEDDAGE